MPSVDVFISQPEEGGQTVALVLGQPLIIEYEGELAPVVHLTHGSARDLAHTLIELADQIYSEL